MPDFFYRAVRADGKVIQGQLDALSREAVIRQLQGRSLVPLEVSQEAVRKASSGDKKEKTASTVPRRKLFTSDRGVKQADIHQITRELAIMLRAGLSLDRALRVLCGMDNRPSVQALLEDVFKSVKAGKGLSQALMPYQLQFGEFYINMVRSGEVGGQLSDVLGRLAEHLERAKALRDSVISASIYPLILVVVAALSVFVMLGFVVPKFEPLFNSMGSALPLPTRFIVELGDFIQRWGWLITLLMVGFVLGMRRWMQKPAGQDWRDSFVLKIPVLAEITRKYETTRFARSMGTLLGNGVPIVNALKIASDTVGNRHLRATMAGVAPMIKQGGRMADALGKTGLFTSLALNMVRLGEETGRLDAMLLELARIYDDEVQASIKRMLILLEPMLILVMGVVIAAIIISILMGILSVSNLAL